MKSLMGIFRFSASLIPIKGFCYYLSAIENIRPLSSRSVGVHNGENKQSASRRSIASKG